MFPSATLWQLNEADVLLTGSTWKTHFRSPPPAALADLALAGVTDPALLFTLYLMRGADLARFTDYATPNTDNLPVLEFHGLRDLDLQTHQQNLADLVSFPKQTPAPAEVAAVHAQMTPDRLVGRARMFEKAESYRLAFEARKAALEAVQAIPKSSRECCVQLGAGGERKRRYAPGSYGRGPDGSTERQSSGRGVIAHGRETGMAREAGGVP